MQGNRTFLAAVSGPLRKAPRWIAVQARAAWISIQRAMSAVRRKIRRPTERPRFDGGHPAALEAVSDGREAPVVATPGRAPLGPGHSETPAPVSLSLYSGPPADADDSASRMLPLSRKLSGSARRWPLFEPGAQEYRQWLSVAACGVVGLIVLALLFIWSLKTAAGDAHDPLRAPAATSRVGCAHQPHGVVVGTAHPASSSSPRNVGPVDPPLPQPESPPSAVVEERADLSLEFVRLPDPPKPHSAEPFLVSSIASADGRAPAATAPPLADGWSAHDPRRRRLHTPADGQRRLMAERIPAFAATFAGTQVGTARLALHIVADEQCAAGRALPVRFIITNTGTAEATDVMLHVDLPEGMWHHKGRRLEYPAGRLAPGESHSAVLTPCVTESGPLTVTAEAAAADTTTVHAEHQFQARGRKPLMHGLPPHRLGLPGDVPRLSPSS